MDERNDYNSIPMQPIIKNKLAKLTEHMTPKEKAEELVDRFMNIRNIKLSDYSIIYLPTAKQCVLIAVEEILYTIVGTYDFDSLNEYWQEVKKEIEKL